MQESLQRYSQKTSTAYPLLPHFRFPLYLQGDSSRYASVSPPSPALPQGMCKRIHGHPVHMLRSCCGQVHSLLQDLPVLLRFLQKENLLLLSDIFLLKCVKYLPLLHLFLLRQEDGFLREYPDSHLQQRPIPFSPSAFLQDESKDLSRKQQDLPGLLLH